MRVVVREGFHYSSNRCQHCSNRFIVPTASIQFLERKLQHTTLLLLHLKYTHFMMLHSAKLLIMCIMFVKDHILTPCCYV